ncbi:MAG: choice-of-anchor X domain-containing protein [Candidatus Poseidoniales archaeon]|jgi:hypothetical protein|tara:strand:- start:22834 stop:25878 length:3045 start_codon:yes stop_codon:yes gene_type:complete
MKIQFSTIIVTLLFFSSMPISTFGEGSESNVTCEIIADWGVKNQWENSNYSTQILHRYTVNFDPPYANGESPGGVNIDVQQFRDNLNVLGEGDISSVNAGGFIDIVLTSQPEFNDSIMIELETSDSSCSRSLVITQWNQPIANHEVTRETNWQMGEGEDGEGENDQSLSFEGRGWQKRTGSLMESNELGNGSIVFDISDGSNIGTLSLSLDRVWLNETYDGPELLKQEFEMIGSGTISLTNQGEDAFSIEAQIKDAYILRSWSQQTLTERISIEGSGWLSFNGGSNNSSQGGFGEISLFYYETWDDNGIRRLQNTQLEANVTLRVNSVGGAFSFDLDDFFMREKWENGLLEEQYMKMQGSGNFDFIASESPYIEVNGTIPLIHIESQGGETVSDTIIVDGTFDGDAEGSFGFVRKIIDSGAYANESGEYFEADKIQNELWLNVSATPFGPIDQELEAEHNLTYEYTAPQEDWENRIFKYEYVEDNGSVNYEYPPNSPNILEATPPSSNSIFSNQISRETGVCPEILSAGDQFILIGNPALILNVIITDFDEVVIDSHLVSIAIWEGEYGDSIYANGSIINEGKLAGLLNEVYRNVDLGIGIDTNNESIRFIEHQSIDAILYPSIITLDENTIPNIDTTVESSVRFREGFLFAEGGYANLEIMVNDSDTDVISVFVDLTPLGLGIVSLSDSGINGDLIIRDGIWTTEIKYNGLQYGSIDFNVFMNDIWVSVTQIISLEISNPAPRMTSIDFSPEIVFRGDIISITIEAIDGHGIESVIVDMFAYGGELTFLEFEGSLWRGELLIPNGLFPGEVPLNIRLTDNEGESRLTNKIYSNDQFKDGKTLEIQNKPPLIDNITILKNKEIVSQISIPNIGNYITHTLEIMINDIDGISSAQIKIGRLAPIGSSNVWLLLVDDGFGEDRVAGDGIYTISFDVRSTLLQGDFIISIRATDNYLSMTPLESQSHTLVLAKLSANEEGSNNWLKDNSMNLVISSMILMLISGIAGAVYLIRKSDI